MIRFKRLLKSFNYAVKGLAKVCREEQNLKVQFVAAVVVIILGLWLGITPGEWGLIVFSITLVILMEITNSAIERTTDILKPRIHDYVKEIKDIMAAAVMLASISAVVVGLIVFLPRIIPLLGK